MFTLGRAGWLMPEVRDLHTSHPFKPTQRTVGQQKASARPKSNIVTPPKRPAAGTEGLKGVWVHTGL